MSRSESQSSCSRRVFMQTAVALSACLSSNPASSAQKTGPHLDFPSEPRQRLAVTSYPFRAYIDSPTNPARDATKPGMDLKEFPAVVAKRFGVHNINPLGDHLRSTDPEYLETFRRALDAANSHIVDLGLSGRDFSTSDNSKRDDSVAYGQRWIDIAVRIGSPSVRQHLRTAPGASPSVANTVESLSRLADYGAQKNVVVNLENDSPGSEEPFFIAEVLGKANHPYLRALPDFGNSLRGHDAAYNKRAVEAMFKYAYNMSHVKDVLRAKDGQVFHVDIPQMFAVARANSYRGYFSMEFDTGNGDPFEGTQDLVAQSLKYMVQTSDKSTQ